MIIKYWGDSLGKTHTHNLHAQGMRAWNQGQGAGMGASTQA